MSPLNKGLGDFSFKSFSESGVVRKIKTHERLFGVTAQKYTVQKVSAAEPDDPIASVKYFFIADVKFK